MGYRLFLTAAGFALFCSPTAHADIELIKQCDVALVKATYASVDRNYVDWRMAESISEDAYNGAKTDIGYKGEIYGVPASGNFNQFKEKIKRFKRESNQSYSREEFRSVAWTGLDPNSVQTYQACLRTAYLIEDVPRRNAGVGERVGRRLDDEALDALALELAEARV